MSEPIIMAAVVPVKQVKRPRLYMWVENKVHGDGMRCTSNAYDDLQMLGNAQDGVIFALPGSDEVTVWTVAKVREVATTWMDDNGWNADELNIQGFVDFARVLGAIGEVGQ